MADTREELERRIAHATRKRDHVVDVLGKPLLGLTYQMEIDKLAAELEKLPHSAGEQSK